MIKITIVTVSMLAFLAVFTTGQDTARNGPPPPPDACIRKIKFLDYNFSTEINTNNYSLY